MSLVNQPTKVPTLPVDPYDDIDDDDLSDISEESHEDDTSDSLNAKVGQNTSIPSSANTGSNYPKKNTGPDPTKSDFIPPLVNTRPVVQARRLEYTDSDDTTSGNESHLAKLSAVETFYSPDQSVDINEESEGTQGSDEEEDSDKSESIKKAPVPVSSSDPSGTLSKLVKTTPAPVPQQTSVKIQQDDEDDEDEDEDEEDEDEKSDESESTDTVKKVSSSDKMQLGETWYFFSLGDVQNVKNTN